MQMGACARANQVLVARTLPVHAEDGVGALLLRVQRAVVVPFREFVDIPMSVLHGFMSTTCACRSSARL